MHKISVALCALRDHSEKKSVPKQYRGTVCPISTLFRKSGTILVPFFQRGTVSKQKKVDNSIPLEKGTILVPLGNFFP